ncbi:MAG: type I-E CRISPR-associated protein Cas7/Cse4/CasC [Balneolales bacterium]
MSNSKFLQIHTLTSYPGTLLNRDDAGFAKRLPFGGSTRTRISSQCLKYHWRNFKGEHALYNMDVPRSYRSRETFQRRVAKPLVDEGYPESLVLAGTFSLIDRLLSDKQSGKNEIKKLIRPDEGQNPWEQLETSQITVFGEPEMRYLRQLLSEKLDEFKEKSPAFWEADGSVSDDAIEDAVKMMQEFSKKELKNNLKALRTASGLDAAMFGRMVTSDVLARGDAAIHVAHAFTTHAEESESDYFSAVDELRRDEPEESGELGAGHINSTEIASGLFYQYVVIDLPLLVSNIEGVSRNEWDEADKALSMETIKSMIHLIATVSPGAKLGSTAPYSYAQCMLVESGSAQPRTLANAFERAVPKNGQGVLANSYNVMGKYISEMDRMYDLQLERKLAAVGPTELLLEPLEMDETVSVRNIADWAARQAGGE